MSLVQGGRVGAMIDVSDGLSSDLGHVLDASGVGAELWADRVPVHDDARRLAGRDGRDALAHALDDGEDFELCFTTDDERARRLERDGLAGTRVARIGRVTADRSYVLRATEGAAASRTIERRGYDHFPRG
jgi:thiamine-monophosphate kinase